MNAEIRMTNDETTPNRKIVGRLCQTPWRFAETPYNYQRLDIPSAFGIRASSFSCPVAY
jgi:hypothetical protein